MWHPHPPLWCMIGALVAVGGVGLAAQSAEDRARLAEQEGRWQEAFEGYVKAIGSGRGRPDDEIRLRGHVLRLATSLRLSPPMPVEATYARARGQSILRQAANDAAIGNAQAELERAVRLAPWSRDLAFDLAVVLELRGEKKRAADNFRLYLVTDPPDAREVRSRIATLSPAARDDENGATDGNEIARRAMRDNRPLTDGARTFQPVRLAGIWLQSDAWRLPSTGDIHPNARQFLSVDNQMSGRILGSWLPLTPADLKATALRNARAASAAARIVKETWMRKDELDVLDLEIELPGGRVPHLLIGHYVTGAPGTVQLTILVPRDVAESRRGEIVAVFNSLVMWR